MSFIIKICAFSSENKATNLILLFINIFTKGFATIFIISKGFKEKFWETLI